MMQQQQYEERADLFSSTQQLTLMPTSLYPHTSQSNSGVGDSEVSTEAGAGEATPNERIHCLTRYLAEQPVTSSATTRLQLESANTYSEALQQQQQQQQQQQRQQQQQQQLDAVDDISALDMSNVVNESDSIEVGIDTHQMGNTTEAIAPDDYFNYYDGSDPYIIQGVLIDDIKRMYDIPDLDRYPGSKKKERERRLGGSGGSSSGLASDRQRRREKGSNRRSRHKSRDDGRHKHVERDQEELDSSELTANLHSNANSTPVSTLEIVHDIEVQDSP